MSTLLVVLLIGATLRLTRLLTTDALLESGRSWIERRLPAGMAKLAYLIRCDWCMSVWVGFAVFTVGWYAPDTPTWIVSGALTASLITGWASYATQAFEITMLSAWEHEENGS
jgi:hypothetical protein